MISDRLDNDIAPAKALGMGTVWVKQGFGRLQTPLPRETPDCAVECLAELLGIFQTGGAGQRFPAAEQEIVAISGKIILRNKL